MAAMQYPIAMPAAQRMLADPQLQQELAAAFLVQLPHLRQRLAASCHAGGLHFRHALLLLRGSALHLCVPPVAALCLRLDQAVEQVAGGLPAQARLQLVHDVLAGLRGLERCLHALM